MYVCKGKTKNFGQKILGTKRPLNESSNEEVDRLCVHRIFVNPNHFLTADWNSADVLNESSKPEEKNCFPPIEKYKQIYWTKARNSQRKDLYRRVKEAILHTFFMASIFSTIERPSRAVNTLPIELMSNLLTNSTVERGIGFISWGATKSMTSLLLLLGDELAAIGGGGDGTCRWRRGLMRSSMAMGMFSW